jgi:hypothetical protein
MATQAQATTPTADRMTSAAMSIDTAFMRTLGSFRVSG